MTEPLCRFDTLDHDILPDKMKYLGFASKVIDWFGSYLKKRNIVVTFEKTLSEIPQGSILGPILLLLPLPLPLQLLLLLLLLDVNNMKTALKNCDLRLYADDRLYFIATKMSSSSKEI